MTEPASWQPDPTGRHDHRYWDGTQWTEHVADAGVSATDPYDGPADATPAAAAEAAPAEPAAAEPEDAAVSGWGAATEPSTPEPAAEEAPAATAWGSTAAEPAAAIPVEAEPAAEAPTEVTPAPTWSTPTPTTWGSTPAVEETPTEVAPAPTWGSAAEDAPTEVTPAPTWGSATPETPEADEPTESIESGLGFPSPAPTAWGTPSTDEPADATAAWSSPSSTDAPPPIVPTPVPGSPGGGSRTGLVVGIALLAIVAIVIALVVVGGGDDDDKSPDEIAGNISSELQDEFDLSDDDAECISEYIVDEIGPSRLEGVDFSANDAPDDLEVDFNTAFNGAISECDIDPTDVVPSTDGGSDDGDSDSDSTDDTTADGGDDATDTSTDIGDPEEFKDLLADQYESTLGLDRAKSECLAERMVGAVESGELTEDEAFGEFFTYLEACDISLEELSGTPN